MATMNVSLPDQMKTWVESRTRDGRYSNASDYVRDLIRQDQTKAFADLQALVSEGLESGLGTKSKADIINEARKLAKARS